jgi:DNA repair exonuclease SbcCD ATPase subunit
MRLISITVRNYRIHRDLTVELDPERTVIGGPNESGKSTLAEAAHRALFLKARGNREEHRAMKSDLHGGNPEVEVRFETGGREYTVAKKFSGNNGTALLTEAGGETWHDSDAEQRLLELLRADATGASAKELLNHWGHLWAWQGEVARDPMQLANAKGDDLVGLLQAEGGAVLQMSQRDKQVANAMDSAVAEIFTNKGEPRVQSAYGQAAKAAGEAQAGCDQAEEQFRKLEEAITGYREAGDDLAEQGKIITDLEDGKKDLGKRDEKIKRLQQEQTGQSTAAQTVGEKYNEILKADQSITVCRETTGELETGLAPGRKALKELKTARKKATANWQAAQEALDQANEAAKNIRDHHGLARDHGELFKLAETLTGLEEKWSQAEALRKTIKVCRKKLARLPRVDTSLIERLQELENGAGTLETKLNATAARIELLAGEVDVSVDGAPLTAGNPAEITHDAELVVGEVARLKISPGGGENLDNLRQQAADARKAFESALHEAAVVSTSKAVEVRAVRDELSSQQRTAEAELTGLGGDDIKQQLDETKTKHETLDGRLERARDFNPPENRETAEASEQALSAKLTDSEIAESTRLANRNSQIKAKDEADKNAEAKSDEISGQETNLTTKKAELEALIKIHGEDQSRAENLQSLLAKKNAADQQLKLTKAELKKLQPDSIQADLDRNQRALNNANEIRQKADVKQGIAKGIFTTDGSADPKAELETAQLRAQAAQARLSNEQRQARATQLLDQFFQEQKQELDDQYGNQLANKVAEYLTRLYGDDTSASIRSDEDGFAAMSINRPKLAGRSFAFDTLSGGTQEQTAAALRLAMAEILAAGHDDCLPVVLDDAFANSDPQRIVRIQAMLDHAAVRGLQVIVLTCNPAEYASLGAKQIQLDSIRLAVTKSAQSQPAPDSTPQETQT